VLGKWTIVAVLVAACAAADAADPPKDEAARRATIAKLGRVAWSGKDQPLEFCDLDGGNVVASDAGRVSFVKWMPDGRRVLASGDGRVFVVDAATGKSKNLAADAPDDRFAAWIPAVSPDGKFAVYWRARQGGAANQWTPVAVAAFDLDAGTRADVGRIVQQTTAELSLSGPPPAWWSPDGTLYAAVSPELDEVATPGMRWKLVKWKPGGAKRQTVAEIPSGSRITRMAFHGGRCAYVVQPQDGGRGARVVVLDGGKVAFEPTPPAPILAVAWEEDGAALRVELQSPETRKIVTNWRVVPGEAATQIPEFMPPTRVPTGDPAWEVETRNPPTNPDAGTFPTDVDEPTTGLFRVATATSEATHVCPGRSPQRVGDVIVFWRVTVAARKKEGQYFEMAPTIPGTDDLWAYDVKDGAVIRLSERGFAARCYDIRPTPDAAKEK